MDVSSPSAIYVYSYTLTNLPTSDQNVFAFVLGVAPEAAIDSIKSRLRDNGFPRADVAASYTVYDTIAHRARVSLEVSDAHSYAARERFRKQVASSRSAGRPST